MSKLRSLASATVLSGLMACGSSPTVGISNTDVSDAGADVADGVSGVSDTSRDAFSEVIGSDAYDADSFVDTEVDTTTPGGGRPVNPGGMSCDAFIEEGMACTDLESKIDFAECVLDFVENVDRIRGNCCRDFEQALADVDPLSKIEPIVLAHLENGYSDATGRACCDFDETYCELDPNVDVCLEEHLDEGCR